MTRILSILILCALVGCTTTGGRPRFKRSGETMITPLPKPEVVYVKQKVEQGVVLPIYSNNPPEFIPGEYDERGLVKTQQNYFYDDLRVHYYMDETGHIRHIP